MGLSYTKLQKEAYDYLDNHDFIPAHISEDFKRRLEQEGSPISLSISLEKFRIESCPKCGTTGTYKWHFLGRYKHSDCGWSWYISPGVYIASQLRAVLRAGMEAASENTGKQEGCLTRFFGSIFAFFFGITVRLPFVILTIPIQAIISLTQRKP